MIAGWGEGVDLAAGGVGVAGVVVCFDPQRLQVGEGGAGGEVVLELAYHGHDLAAEPARLGVGAQQQADVGGGRLVGEVHFKHPCSVDGPGLRPARRTAMVGL